MALGPGTRLGAYEILTLIGSGGMGEVYRAKDTKLHRDVAIKVLPTEVAADSDRLARFEREAQVLASLNHPNIAHIHGVEDSTGAPALVMELVEGPTLADRIAKGPIPLDEALQIAKQIAEALEAAHEQGIIHRDLKPANIKVRPDGAVKVLDFGLAKAFEPVAAGASATMSPTLSIHATQAGIILGTAAYMAPEQARGKPVDRRADIWAFGCVVYEMLVGKPVFEGDTITDVIAHVVTREPDWHLVPSSVPAALRELAARCLKKDPRERLQAIGDARIALSELSSAEPNRNVTSTEPSSTASLFSRMSKRAAVLLSASALAAGAAMTAAVVWDRDLVPIPAMRPVHFEITADLYVSQVTDRNVAVSRDGSTLAYGGPNGLNIRAIDQIESRLIPGTGGARWPVFSPDAKWIAFYDGFGIKKVPVAGGSPITVCRCPGIRGAAWGDGNVIFFGRTGTSNNGISSVSAGGGEPTVQTTLDRNKEYMHAFPSVLPSGTLLITVLHNAQGLNEDGNEVVAIDPRTGHRTPLLRGSSGAQYLPPRRRGEPGYLLYGVSGRIEAVQFDAERLRVLGDSVTVVEHVRQVPAATGDFNVSREGTLVYVPGGARLQNGPLRSLVWVDRVGREETIPAPMRTFVYPRLSPDGARLAVQVTGQSQDIWIWDLARRSFMQLTFDAADDQYPVWTRDGKRIIFMSTRAPGGGNIFWQSADGSGNAERLTTSATTPHFTYSLSPRDGRSLVFTETRGETGRDLSMALLPPSGAASSGQPVEVRPLLQTPAAEINGDISPDGQWLAYQSNEQSGQDEVFVRPFPNVDAGKWLVSSGGGSRPLWARNGKELFYLDADGYLTAVPVQTVPTFAASTPMRLLKTRYFAGLGGLTQAGRTYDVSLDGRRFVMVKEESGAATAAKATIVVVLNLITELEAKFGKSAAR